MISKRGFLQFKFKPHHSFFVFFFYLYTLHIKRRSATCACVFFFFNLFRPSAFISIEYILFILGGKKELSRFVMFKLFEPDGA